MAVETALPPLEDHPVLVGEGAPSVLVDEGEPEPALMAS